MKKAVLVIIVLVVAWLCWDFIQHGESTVLTRERVDTLLRRESTTDQAADPDDPATVAASYRRSLENAFSQLDQPLAAGPADQRSALDSLRDRLAREATQGRLPPDQARVARQLVGRLKHLNGLRQQHAQAYASTSDRPLRSFGGADRARQARTFQLEQHEERWQELLAEHRAVIQRELQQLPAN